MLLSEVRPYSQNPIRNIPVAISELHQRMKADALLMNGCPLKMRENSSLQQPSNRLNRNEFTPITKKRGIGYSAFEPRNWVTWTNFCIYQQELKSISSILFLRMVQRIHFPHPVAQEYSSRNHF